MKVFAALAWGLLMCCYSNAQPSIAENIIYYPVAPKADEDWATALHKQSPIRSQGQRFHASTQWSVHWYFSTSQANGHCVLQSVQVFLDISRTFPQLQQSVQLNPQQRQRWHDYYQALQDHEDQHKTFAVRAANEVEAKLQRLAKRQNYDCPTLRYKADQQSHRIISKYQRQNSDYDITSHHGSTDKADIALYL